jgi:hypothetical protein
MKIWRRWILYEGQLRLCVSNRCNCRRVKQVVHRLITTWADFIVGKKFNSSFLIIVAYWQMHGQFKVVKNEVSQVLSALYRKMFWWECLVLRENKCQNDGKNSAQYFVVFLKNYHDTEIKENEVGGKCIMDVEDEKFVNNFRWNPEVKGPNGSPSLMCGKILKWIVWFGGWGLNWIG